MYICVCVLVLRVCCRVTIDDGKWERYSSENILTSCTFARVHTNFPTPSQITLKDTGGSSSSAHASGGAGGSLLITSAAHDYFKQSVMNPTQEIVAELSKHKRAQKEKVGKSGSLLQPGTKTGAAYNKGMEAELKQRTINGEKKKKDEEAAAEKFKVTSASLVLRRRQHYEKVIRAAGAALVAKKDFVVHLGEFNKHILEDAAKYKGLCALLADAKKGTILSALVHFLTTDTVAKAAIINAAQPLLVQNAQLHAPLPHPLAPLAPLVPLAPLAPHAPPATLSPHGSVAQPFNPTLLGGPTVPLLSVPQKVTKGKKRGRDEADEDWKGGEDGGEGGGTSTRAGKVVTRGGSKQIARC